MINSFENIINFYRLFCNANGIGFENIARLLVRELATFYMIGIIAKIYLSTVINRPLALFLSLVIIVLKAFFIHSNFLVLIASSTKPYVIFLL